MPLTTRRILQTWWPLAASWLLMGAEQPILGAVIARLAAPEINLAAYGGVVYPLALVIESPIIMLLAASTALSRDWDSYAKIWRFMTITSAALTVLHLLIVLTPFYYTLVNVVLRVPPEIVEPARIGLLIMTPWSWAIAYRRFNQGVLIRFGRSRVVSAGTLVRLGSETLVLIVGFVLRAPGIIVAAAGIAVAVVSEAVYVGVKVQPVLQYDLRAATPVSPALTMPAFFQFYVPLVLTSLLGLLAQPIGSSAISRMPGPLPSLAVWPVVAGLIFLLRSMGVAYNEVVVALLDEPRSARLLRRFAVWLTVGTTAFMLVFAATPLARFWFGSVSALSPDLAGMARLGIWLAVLMPGLTVLQSWFQGVILQSRRTRSISEAVVVYLAVSLAVLAAGVAWGRFPGLYVGLAAMVLSTAAQTFWLWARSRGAIRLLFERDEAQEVSASASPS